MLGALTSWAIDISFVQSQTVSGSKMTLFCSSSIIIFRFSFPHCRRCRSRSLSALSIPFFSIIFSYIYIYNTNHFLILYISFSGEKRKRCCVLFHLFMLDRYICIFFSRLYHHPLTLAVLSLEKRKRTEKKRQNERHHNIYIPYIYIEENSSRSSSD